MAKKKNIPDSETIDIVEQRNRIAVVGVTGIGRRHLQTCARSGLLDLAFDEHPPGSMDGRSVYDPSALLANPKAINWLVLSVNRNQQALWLLRAVRHNWSVLVEPPLPMKPISSSDKINQVVLDLASNRVQVSIPVLYHPGLTGVSIRNRRSIEVSVVERRPQTGVDVAWGPFFHAVALACKLAAWGGYKLPPLTSVVTESTVSGVDTLIRSTWETPFVTITAEGAYSAKGDDQTIKINGLSLPSKIDLYAIQLDSVLAGAGIAPLSFAIEAQRATHEALLGLTTPSTKEKSYVEKPTQQ